MATPQAELDLTDREYPPGFFWWLRENRHIYAAFCVKARQMARVRKHYSARAILHVLRWESDLHENRSQFKVNNNWSAGMARLFMQDYPEHQGFFRCRDSLGFDED